MSRIAGVVVHTAPDAIERVRERLVATDGLEVVATAEHGLAVVLTAPNARTQERLHEQVRSWPGVLEVALTFQSADVPDETEVPA